MFDNRLEWRHPIAFIVITSALLFFLPLAALAGSPSNGLPDHGYLGAARSVRLYTENLPPFNYRSENGIAGVGADVVAAMAKIVGHSGKFEMLPWKRVLSALENDPYAAAFSMMRIPEREDEFKWVGPITHAETAFYQLADKPVNIQTLDDARAVAAIGVQAGGASERTLQALGFDNLMSLHVPNNGLKMLLSGRITLWETADLVLNSQVRALGVSSDLVKPALKIGDYDLYLAFSKATPDTVVLPWRQALLELHQNGVFNEIQKRYSIKIDPPSPHKTSFSLLN
jgi:polar amino acid transport system substrate-binding protein